LLIRVAATNTGNFSASRRALSLEAKRKVERSVFLIKEKSMEVDGSSNSSGSRDSTNSGASTQIHTYEGVGVFVSSNRLLTADHVLDDDRPVGSMVDIYNPKLRLKLQAQVLSRDSQYDYAVLGYDGNHPHYLELYLGDPEDLVGESMAMCAFQIRIHEETPEFGASMGVMRAEGVKLSKRKHHLIYTAQAWNGDSGGALVLYEGQLVGLHVEGVNALIEKYDRHQATEQRLSAIEDSLEDAARSVAHACIAILANAFVDAL
jgi:S1-C subfamily serine protease